MNEFLDILSYPGSTGSATRYALRIFRLHRRHAWMEPTTDACIACMADLAMVYSTFIVPWLNFLLFICLLLKYCRWFWNSEIISFRTYPSIHTPDLSMPPSFVPRNAFFHCGGRLVRPDRAWIGVGWVIWKDRNAHWLEMFLSGKSGNVIINRGSSDAYSLKLTNKLNPDCGYDLQTRMNQCIFY